MPFPKIDSDLIDTGVVAGKIIQLDGSARLPAIDGSLLTNLPNAGGVGGRVLLDTVNASNNAEIVFSNFIDGIYKNYLVEMTSIQPSTSNVDVHAQVSNDGGSTYLTGYDQHTQILTHTSVGYNAQVGSADSTINMAIGIGAYGTGSCHGHIILHDPSAVQNHTISGHLAYLKSGADSAGGAFYAELSGSHIINAIKFTLSAGSFVQGTFKLYGLL
ncbi:MAG: hypothetical protein O2942_09220 [Proteobacteria bacterium]|nr:hypothetical protein [Pseudomonadota bacterium]